MRCPEGSPEPAFRVLPFLSLLVTLSGCAGTVINIVGETVEAGVEVAGTAIGTVVDVIIPDDDDTDDDREENGDR